MFRPFKFLNQRTDVHCIKNSGDISVYSHNQTYLSGPHLSVIFHYVAIVNHLSPIINYRTKVGSPCPVTKQLGFCIDGNANPSGEYGERCYPSSDGCELAVELTCVLRNMASLTCSTLSYVRAERGSPCDLQSYTDPSLCQFDTHINRVLRQSIRSWKQLSDTALCDCDRLCFEKQFHCHRAVLH
jgi:hypothetical protein